MHLKETEITLKIEGDIKFYFNKKDNVQYQIKKPIIFKQGKIYLVFGGNGSGKTTFFNILMLLKLSRGKKSSFPILYENKITNERICYETDRVQFKKFGLPKKREKVFSKFFQNPCLLPTLSVRDNKWCFKADHIKDNDCIYLSEKIQQNGNASKEVRKHLYKEIADKKINSFSGGETNLIYMSLFFNPQKPVVIIDELFNELSHLNRAFTLKNKIYKLHNNITIMTEHSFNESDLITGNYELFAELDTKFSTGKDKNLSIRIYELSIDEFKEFTKPFIKKGEEICEIDF